MGAKRFLTAKTFNIMFRSNLFGGSKRTFPNFGITRLGTIIDIFKRRYVTTVVPDLIDQFFNGVSDFRIRTRR
jgi:hypothetical protein